MSIHIISCINPNVVSPTPIDLTHLYDFSFQEHTGKLVTHMKNTCNSTKAKINVLNLQLKHLEIDTPTFMAWVGHMVDFHWKIYKEESDSSSSEPFYEFLRALSNFLPCNSKAVNEIANDFTKWESQARQFGPENFFSKYELLANTFRETRDNGAIWIKHS